MKEIVQQFFGKHSAAKLVLILTLWMLAGHSYATCTTSGQTEADFDAADIYLRAGNLSLADIYSHDDLLKMVTIMAHVTCENSPVYVAIQGSPTQYFSVQSAVFKYDTVADSYGIAALLNTIPVTIAGKGQAIGAKVFDLYIADEKIEPGEGWKGLHVLGARAEHVDTDWVPAECALDVPSSVTLPDASPGEEVSAGLKVEIKCDKTPNTYISYYIAPQSNSFDAANGIIYNENNIKINLSKDGSPVDLSQQISIPMVAGDNFSSTDNYKITSDIGKSASSGEYSTDLIVYLFHN